MRGGTGSGSFYRENVQTDRASQGPGRLTDATRKHKHVLSLSMEHTLISHSTNYTHINLIDLYQKGIYIEYNILPGSSAPSSEQRSIFLVSHQLFAMVPSVERQVRTHSICIVLVQYSLVLCLVNIK